MFERARRHMSCITENEKGSVGTPPSATSLLKSSVKPHPAWAQLVEVENTNLAWRRAACQDNNANAISELARGGVLQILQRGGLAIPPKTKGAVNAYVTAKLTDELGRAVQAYLVTSNDAFYSVCPKENVNYGGKGAGQQLWWSNKAKGWRVTQPNRHMMAQTTGSPRAGAERPSARVKRRGDAGARKQTEPKRQRLSQMPTIKREQKPRGSQIKPTPTAISDEEICLLPVHMEDRLGSIERATHAQQTPQILLADFQQPFCCGATDFSSDSEDSSWSEDNWWPSEYPMLFNLGSIYPSYDASGHDCSSGAPDEYEGDSDTDSWCTELDERQHCPTGLHTPWTIVDAG